MTEAERLAHCADIPRMLADIVVMGALKHDIPIRLLRSNRRTPDLIQARWQIAAAARSIKAKVGAYPHRFSLTQIGRALNRDHTTILHGLRKAGFNG